MWVMHVCLFSHTFAGVLRYSIAKEAVRRLLENASASFGEADEDWSSCLGESDSQSTTTGFDSASEGWPESDAWSEDLGPEL